MSTPDHRIVSAPRISKAGFQAVLRRADSPAADENADDALYAICVDYGIDPAVALAFFWKESSLGKAGVGKLHKSWGNRRESEDQVYPRRRYVRSSGQDIGFFAFFPSYAASLRDWCRYMLRRYVRQGLTTVGQILPIYAPSSDGNDPAGYAAKVNTQIAAWQDTRPQAPAPSTPMATDAPSDIRQWRTVAQFRAHLFAHDYAATASWARAVVVHHTERPLPRDWRGERSMRGLEQFYEGKGWEGWPHLFVVSGAPNPEHDGIWQGNPLNLPGIHGNAANGFAWGVEVVGSYNTQRWDAGTAALALGTIAALLDWSAQPTSPESVAPHRQFNPGKTCPGSAIDLAAVRRGVEALRRGA